LAKILSNTPTVTLSVPVNDVGDHMVTAVEQGFEWFVWDNIVYDKDGGVTQATLIYPKDGDEDDCVECTFTDIDFIRGLQRFVEKYGTTREITYQGGGDWDLDASGADSVVQMAVYGELIFS